MNIKKLLLNFHNNYLTKREYFPNSNRVLKKLVKMMKNTQSFIKKKPMKM